MSCRCKGIGEKGADSGELDRVISVAIVVCCERRLVFEAGFILNRGSLLTIEGTIFCESMYGVLTYIILPIR